MFWGLAKNLVFYAVFVLTGRIGKRYTLIKHLGRWCLEHTKMTEGAYVDVKGALDRIRGNKPLYKKLLTTFLANTQFDELKQEMASGNREAAAKIAHAIKGMAGNMSFTALMECAIALEGELKSGQDTAATFSKCEDVFEKTVASVKSLMETL